MKLYLVDALESKYLLISFFNIRKSFINHIINFDKNNLIIDSGAYSMFSKFNYDKNGLLRYVNNYIDFINYYDIKQFIELDIDYVIGYDNVKNIYEYIKRKTGKKPMRVFHIKTRPLSDFYKYCDEDGYFAIGGIVEKSKKFGIKTLMYLLNLPKAKDARLHLLGFTPPNLKDYLVYKNIYSVDSISYNGSMFGKIYFFNNGYMYSYHNKHIKNKLTSSELLSIGINEWLKLQKYLDEYNEGDKK